MDFLYKRPKLLSFKFKQTKQNLWRSCCCYFLFNDETWNFLVTWRPLEYFH